MKRQIALILGTLLLTVCLPMTVAADVIYEPRNNFYEEHREKCTYVSRSYTAAGPNGDVTVYESPESDKVLDKLGNGTTCYISYAYEDASGNLWGCCEYWNSLVIGWVPMAYLELIYDEISFSEEFADQFVSEEGTLSEAYLDKCIVFWEYPGSEGYSICELSNTGVCPSYYLTYMDENGISWGKGSYYFGYRDFWINLEDPTGLPAQKPQVELTAPEESAPGETTPVPEIVPQDPADHAMVQTVLILCVAAVVAVTWVLLKKLRNK